MSEIQPGELFANRFLIEHTAGVGGMGAVYRTRDMTTGGIVALKVLHREIIEEEDSARFLREARILDQLQHPVIAKYVVHGVLPSGQA